MILVGRHPAIIPHIGSEGNLAKLGMLAILHTGYELINATPLSRRKVDFCRFF